MFDWLNALRNGAPVVDIPPGQFTLDQPLKVPTSTKVIRGCGMGVTELRFTGEGMDGIIVAPPFHHWGTTYLERLSITSAAMRGGTALSALYPKQQTVIDPTIELRDVQIRPADNLEAGNPAPDWWRGGGWTKGIRLENAWNTRMQNIWIGGHNGEAAKVQTATLDTAIDCGNSMCVNIIEPHIMNCRVGVSSFTTEVGEAEGLNIIGPGAILNCAIAIYAQSWLEGGRPTPSMFVRGLHTYAFTHGIVAIGRSAVLIEGCEISQHHFAPEDIWYYGVYLKEQTYGNRIINNAFWRGALKPWGTGLITSAQDSTFVGNSIAPGFAHGVTFDSEARFWRGSGNANRAAAPVIDFGRDNRI